MVQLFLLGFGCVVLTIPVGSVSLEGPYILPLVLSSDPLSSSFLVVLYSITIAVMLWSYYYLDTEASFLRLFYLISLFITSITILLVSGSLLLLFIGWDLLGFSSLFLIFYFRTRSSLYSGLLAGLTNRVGDILFLFLFGCTWFCATPTVWGLLLLLIISMTKSAQVPFSAWLPAAMAAPTPVSALVHSSTLVTAGVYLLVRHLFLFPQVLTFIGALTILFGGLTAFFSTDLNNIVAFSTLSQLGLIIISFLWSSKTTIIFHLLCHGPFNALLFLCVGIGIHGCYGSQELRCSSSGFSSSPSTTVFGVISLVSLCGLPFMAGGVSKHLLIGLYLNSCSALLLSFSFSLGVVLTTAYCTKLLFLFIRPISPSATPFFPLTSFCSLPLLILGFLSVVCGQILGPNLVTPFFVLGLGDGILLLFLIFLGLLFVSLPFQSSQGPSWWLGLESLSSFCLLPTMFSTNNFSMEASIFSLNSLHISRSACLALNSPYQVQLPMLLLCFVFF